jgi:hypothetical protein
MEFITDNYPAIQFIEEIGIVISAKELTPTVINLEFLKFSGIIPKEWQLAQQPIFNPAFVQLNFDSGVNIIAQPRTINFIEAIGRRNVNQLFAPAVACKYIEKLPNAEYQIVSICPKILIPLPASPDAPRKFITESLLTSGSWQELGNKPLEAGVNLIYQLETCQLNINISEVKLQQNERLPVNALLFTGSYNYNLPDSGREQQTQTLTQTIINYKFDFMKFREIVEKKFLRMANLAQFVQEEIVFPSNII